MDNQPELNKIKLVSINIEEMSCPIKGLECAYPTGDCSTCKLEFEAIRQHIEIVKAIKAELDKATHGYYGDDVVIRQNEFEAIFNKHIGGKVNG